MHSGSEVFIPRVEWRAGSQKECFNAVSSVAQPSTLLSRSTSTFLFSFDYLNIEPESTLSLDIYYTLPRQRL